MAPLYNTGYWHQLVNFLLSLNSDESLFSFKFFLPPFPPPPPPLKTKAADKKQLNELKELIFNMTFFNSLCIKSIIEHAIVKK